VLGLERTIHRVILSTLDLLDYQRIATRGFETERKPFALREILDHVLSRQSAAIELAGASIEKEIAADAVPALGDLVRADRAVAVVVRNVLERLEDPRDIRFRVTSEPAHARLEIDAPLRDPGSLIAALCAASAPVEFGEMLGPHVARAWIEAQGGNIDASAERGRTTVVIRLPSGADPAR
jgi:signal transduction histidine kinase